ncbi:MAG: protein-glutamate O-methyltransferase CheR [Desulfobacterales bacterium]|nr:protein-glutamate O-methyltransferase CheR [Desulfobacterales bacterium]MBF0397321.1 protein-glutamate O-methyltransferase CheR [Desulfobacterales bacterium]
MDENIENQNIEITLLLEAIYLKYGYDFRDYAKSSIKRRVMRFMSLSRTNTISEIQHKLIYDKDFFKRFLLDFSIHVTEMFRDPSFYKIIKEKVIPLLRPLPFIKIWHAGCSTGEEVYSMAILLKEENLYEKTRIYATDFNESVINKAKEGIYPLDKMKDYSYNYQKAGGTSDFELYYTSSYEFVLMKKFLKENIVFADHNLATDSIFGEMNMIICRNVLIYFNKNLQNKVIKLFRDSLCEGGFLCLGTKESLIFSKYVNEFEEFASKEKIYLYKGSHYR